MNKLSLDALKERAESAVSEELLMSIAGGINNNCHCDDFEKAPIILVAK